MNKFRIAGRARWKHLNSNEIHWCIDNDEYTTQLTNEWYDKVVEMYKHTPGKAFNIAKANCLSKTITEGANNNE